MEELLNDIAVIKWAVICIAASMWGITAYLFLKELPEWWHSYDKKKSNLDKLPKGTYEGGHY